MAEAGDCIEISTPCGGGYGDPLARSPEQVRDDVLDGFSNPDHAFAAYGVVLDTDLEIDAVATEARRAEMRKAVA